MLSMPHFREARRMLTVMLDPPPPHSPGHRIFQKLSILVLPTMCLTRRSASASSTAGLMCQAAGFDGDPYANEGRSSICCHRDHEAGNPVGGPNASDQDSLRHTRCRVDTLDYRRPNVHANYQPSHYEQRRGGERAVARCVHSWSDNHPTLPDTIMLWLPLDW